MITQIYKFYAKENIESQRWLCECVDFLIQLLLVMAIQILM